MVIDRVTCEQVRISYSGSRASTQKPCDQIACQTRQSRQSCSGRAETSQASVMSYEALAGSTSCTVIERSYVAVTTQPINQRLKSFECKSFSICVVNGSFLSMCKRTLRRPITTESANGIQSTSDCRCNVRIHTYIQHHVDTRPHDNTLLIRSASYCTKVKSYPVFHIVQCACSIWYRQSTL